MPGRPPVLAGLTVGNSISLFVFASVPALFAPDLSGSRDEKSCEDECRAAWATAQITGRYCCNKYVFALAPAGRSAYQGHVAALHRIGRRAGA
jgi:hypothetical protein